MVISAKQVLICSFPHLRTPVGKRIRSWGLNLAAISALVEKILERQNNFVLFPSTLCLKPKAFDFLISKRDVRKKSFFFHIVEPVMKNAN